MIQRRIRVISLNIQREREWRKPRRNWRQFRSVSSALSTIRVCLLLCSSWSSWNTFALDQYPPIENDSLRLGAGQSANDQGRRSVLSVHRFHWRCVHWSVIFFYKKKYPSLKILFRCDRQRVQVSDWKKKESNSQSRAEDPFRTRNPIDRVRHNDVISCSHLETLNSVPWLRRTMTSPCRTNQNLLSAFFFVGETGTADWTKLRARNCGRAPWLATRRLAANQRSIKKNTPLSRDLVTSRPSRPIRILRERWSVNTERKTHRELALLDRIRMRSWGHFGCGSAGQQPISRRRDPRQPVRSPADRWRWNRNGARRPVVSSVLLCCRLWIPRRLATSNVCLRRRILSAIAPSARPPSRPAQRPTR